MATESFDSVFKLTKESSERLLEKMSKPVVKESPEDKEARLKWVYENEKRSNEIMAQLKKEGRLVR